jgi:hypothetical protein
MCEDQISSNRGRRTGRTRKGVRMRQLHRRPLYSDRTSRQSPVSGIYRTQSRAVEEARETFTHSLAEHCAEPDCQLSATELTAPL